jgi:hypothetical protein
MRVNPAFVLAAALFTAPAAHAGGLGILGTGGFHTERLFYYSSADPDTYDDEEPVLYLSPSDYDQYTMVQNVPNLGGGLELLLGDRDDKITGSFRAYYLKDSQQKNPGDLTDTVDPDYLVAAYREDPRHLGLGLIGLNWGIVDFASDRLRLGLSTHIGAGFVTIDHTEFFLGSAGPSLTYKASRRVHIFGDALYQARVRQTLSHSVNGMVGARYYFD